MRALLKRYNMLLVFVSAGTLVASLLYALNSGVAEGFASIQSIVIVPILIGNIWILIGFSRFLYKKLRKSEIVVPRPRLLGVTLCVLALSDALLFSGNRIDSNLINETKLRGDRLLLNVSKFKEAKGTFPKNLDELGAAGFTLEQPALKGSTFRYAISENGEPYLSFGSVAFLVCTRDLAELSWRCDD
jgi:hypothetical protein